MAQRNRVFTKSGRRAADRMLSTSTSQGEAVWSEARRESGVIELTVFGAHLKLLGDIDTRQLNVMLDAMARNR